MSRCLFCKNISIGARSVEHILPESVGNRNRTLAPGTLCDPCNNYFARKVEAPVLEHDSFRNLRARWQIPNKQRKMPRWRGELAGTDIFVGLRLSKDGQPELTLERAGDQERANKLVIDRIKNGYGPAFLFDEKFEPPKYEMSRFLAKMALETLAQRNFWAGYERIDHLLDDPHWDPIRIWARRGSGVSGHWPYSQRVIAPELTYQYLPESNTWVRAGFSCDLFMTRRTEIYFAVSFYGHEFVVNLGGPSTKGYEEWLVENSGISPLVERVGMKLVERYGPHGHGHYWEGDGRYETGAAFDKRQS